MLLTTEVNKQTISSETIIPLGARNPQGISRTLEKTLDRFAFGEGGSF
jgi:hypothetical protein